MSAIPDRPTAPLKIRLFGPLDVQVKATGVPPMPARGKWLLALLVLRHGQAVSRSRLAGTLWEEADRNSALGSLRQALGDLRRGLGDEAWRVTKPSASTLHLDPAGADVDVVTFDSAVERGDPASLKKAVETYTAPLLEGWHTDWAAAERNARREAYLKSRLRLSENALAEGRIDEAIEHLRRGVVAEELQEHSLHEALMRVLIQRGDYHAARELYRERRHQLHVEAHAEPHPDLTKLYDQARAEGKRWRPQPVTGSKAGDARSSPDRAPAVFVPPIKPWLPSPLTALIGRDAEVEELRTLFRDNRLVTLTGPGGVGKTRLAVAVATESAEEYPDGAGFVDLSALRDPELILQTVAVALGLRAPDELLTALRPRQLLLVLDNCEHLLPASAIRALLEHCPHLRVLATSRQRLNITGEVARQVPLLEVPEDDAWFTVAQAAGAGGADIPLGGYPTAVQLFVTRAVAAQQHFRVTPQNALAVGQICRRLDGIPLAIELAAVEVETLSAEELAARLDHRLPLLTDGDRTKPERQWTLRAVLDWSYERLTEAEKVVLRRLALFSGGWTLGAAERVTVGDTPETRIVKDQVLNLVKGLVDRSLVVAFPSETSPLIRYRLLETVREYAMEKLQGAGEAERVGLRHLEFFLWIAKGACPPGTPKVERESLARLEADHDNLRAALDWCLPRVDHAEQGLELAVNLGPFWETRGYYTEGRERTQAALRSVKRVDSPLYAEGLQLLGVLAWRQGAYDRARDSLEDARQMFERLTDQPGLARVFTNLGNVARDTRDFDTASQLYEASLLIDQALSNQRGEAANRNNLGLVECALGRHAAARDYFERARVIWRQEKDAGREANATHNLGMATMELGDYPRALHYYELARSLYEKVGDLRGVATVLNNLGVLWRARGDLKLAYDHLTRSLALFGELETWPGIGNALVELAGLASAKEPERAIVLFGAASTIAEQLGTADPALAYDGSDADLGQARSQLSEGNYARAWARGSTLSMDEAIAYAQYEGIAQP